MTGLFGHIEAMEMRNAYKILEVKEIQAPLKTMLKYMLRK
jgi:hypothetical protein